MAREPTMDERKQLEKIYAYEQRLVEMRRAQDRQLSGCAEALQVAVARLDDVQARVDEVHRKMHAASAEQVGELWRPLDTGKALAAGAAIRELGERLRELRTAIPTPLRK